MGVHTRFVADASSFPGSAASMNRETKIVRSSKRVAHKRGQGPRQSLLLINGELPGVRMRQCARGLNIHPTR